MKKISVILIILGIIIFSIPFTGKILNDINRDNLINELLKQNKALDTVFKENTPDKNGSGNSNNNENVKTIKSQTVLGKLKIKKLGIDQYILEGTSKDVLGIAFGHLIGTSSLGGNGNAVIAGHRNHAFGYYFNRLNELKAGDEVKLLVNNKEYLYIVTDSKIVLPSDISVLEGGTNENILTLITCDPPYIASHRLIVRAQLVNQ